MLQDKRKKEEREKGRGGREERRDQEVGGIEGRDERGSRWSSHTLSHTHNRGTHPPPHVHPILYSFVSSGLWTLSFL
jgi:hypothetical protein